MRGGYSHDLVVFLRSNHPLKTVARLGRVCIEQDIPVKTIAERLGVSRQTVYNWFWAQHEPRTAQLEAIQAYTRELLDQKQAASA